MQFGSWFLISSLVDNPRPPPHSVPARLLEYGFFHFSSLIGYVWKHSGSLSSSLTRPVSPSWRNFLLNCGHTYISTWLCWEGNSPPSPQRSSHCADSEIPLSSSQVFSLYNLGGQGSDLPWRGGLKTFRRVIVFRLSESLSSVCELSHRFWVAGKSLFTVLPHTDIRLQGK